MDKLIQEAKDHGAISESLAFFRQALDKLNAKGISYMCDLEKFLCEYVIRHFRFEEEQLFPKILEKGTKEEKDFIQELLREHAKITDIVKQFKQLISQYGLAPDNEQMIKYIKLNRQIINLMLAHTREEDIALFPILKKYEADLK